MRLWRRVCAGLRRGWLRTEWLRGTAWCCILPMGPRLRRCGALGAIPVLAPSDLRAEALAGVVARVGARGVVSDRLVDCLAPVWRAEALDGVFGGAAAGDGAGSVVFTLGAELHAFVVGGEVRAVEAACRAGLAAHERPRKLHIVRALPLTASGKVGLVALAAAGGSHAWEG